MCRTRRDPVTDRASDHWDRAIHDRGGGLRLKGIAVIAHAVEDCRHSDLNAKDRAASVGHPASSVNRPVQ